MKTCSVEDCKEPAKHIGFCGAHYQAYRKFGDPLMGKKYVKRGTVQQWIDDVLVTESDKCIQWPFSLQTNGYGTVTVDGKANMAHKRICTLAHGPQPFPKAVVRHTCGEGMRGCVNPKHLKWGTYLENAHDALIHGTRVRGEAQGSNKLTDEEVLEIYDRAFGPESQRAIAEDYGVKQTQVSRIKLGKQWSWLTGAKLNAA